MFLALAPQKEFWDARDEILFIGDWCATYSRAGERANLRWRVLPKPWDDLARYRRAVAECDETFEHVLTALSAYLNAAHGVDHGARYWRVLLGRWLSHYVQQAYNHFTALQDAFAIAPDLRTIRLDPSAYRVPRDSAEFAAGGFSDRHHLQLLSTLLTARGDASPTKRLSDPEKPSFAAPPRRRMAAAAKRALSRTFAALVPPGFGNVLVNELNLDRIEKSRLFAGSGFKVLPYLAQLPAEYKPEPVWDERRSGLARILPDGSPFERAFASTLPHHLPTVYLEGYAAARRFSLSRLWRPPRVVFSVNGWNAEESFKFAAAECAARGSAVWGMQHGGVYGLWEHADSESFERSICDRFFAWGWAPLAKDAKVRNLPHPVLARAKPKSSGRGLLLVPVNMSVHDTTVFRGFGSNLGADYIQRQARLLRSLPKPIQDESSVRFYKKDFGWSQPERLRELYPGLRLADSFEPFQEQLGKTRLAVFDCPMTTFLEAFAADVPLLLTWSPNAWTFRADARPYLDDLKAAGILFDEPEAAAAQAARVYADPRSWWDSPAVRAAREPFAEHFALNKANWLDLWLAEIRGALAPGKTAILPDRA